MRRKRRKNKQIKFIIITSLSLLFILTVGYAAFSTSLNITAKGNVINKSRVIKKWINGSNEDFHTDFYRENIITITFLDTNQVPDNAIESWDVSEAKDKGVMAYVINSASKPNKYDLFIGATRGVIANEDSSYLFIDFSNIETIDFNGNFDTSNTTDMSRMFARCSHLNSLDVSSFDTSNVISMFDMFAYTSNLSDLIGLENFDTSNVTNMQGMFHSCIMTKLNLCHFDTRKVTNMNYMFENTLNLNNVYVGLNWVTTNASIIHLWHQSNISSVTTGQC